MIESPGAHPRSPTATRPLNPAPTERDTVASPSRPDRPTPAEPSITSPQSNNSWPESLAPPEGYEIALDALLSLGGDKSGTPTERGLTPGRQPSPGVLLHRAVSTAPGEVHEDYLGGGSRGDALILDDQSPLGFSESTILGLLRYYRYEIAPWVCLSLSTAQSRPLSDIAHSSTSATSSTHSD